jgi:hypothetical protein
VLVMRKLAPSTEAAFLRALDWLRCGEGDGGLPCLLLLGAGSCAKGAGRVCCAVVSGCIPCRNLVCCRRWMRVVCMCWCGIAGAM